MTITRSDLNDERWWQSVSPDAKHHLLRSLSNLDEGAPTTPTFKLYGKSDWSVVTDFFHQVSHLHDIPDWLLEYEMSREEKYGPQGGHVPWEELRENAEMYFDRVKDVNHTQCNTEKYSTLNVQMLSNSAALMKLKADDKIQTRAAGWRAFNLKKTDQEAQTMALSDLSSGLWESGWAYYFSRYQKRKKRLFVPMPFSNMIGQAKYFNPFLQAIQEDLEAKKDKSEFVFWSDKLGFDFCFHDVVEKKLEGCNPHNLVYVMRDFDKMDTSTGPSQKKHYFLPKLAAALHFPIDSEAYAEMERFILFSNRCPIAVPYEMWVGEHGEASGATVTNGGETCCNEEYDRLLNEKLTESCESQGIRYKSLISVGNGDDGMTIYYLDNIGEFDAFSKCIRDAAEYAASETNFIIQSEKWDIHLGTYGKYCQYLIQYDGQLLRAMYPAALILNSICNPEKEYPPDLWDNAYFDLNIISKLSNGRELPYFRELIDYVDKGMKYGLLGRNSKTAHSILSKYDKYLALQDSSQQYNWYDKQDQRGIMYNPVVKYMLGKERFRV